MSYRSLSSINSEGKVSSRLQGDLLGSFTTMPTASAEYLGQTVLYKGATASGYVKNKMYTCIQSGNSYLWQLVSEDETVGGNRKPVWVENGVYQEIDIILGNAAAKAVDNSIVDDESANLPTSAAVLSAINDATTDARQNTILWDATLIYPSGAVVNVADALYMSKVDNNVGHSPATSPSQWEEIELGSATPQPDINPCNVYKTTIGDGVSKVFTITHDLDTYDVDVTIYNMDADHQTQITRVERPSVNTVRLTFSAAPSSNGLTVVVFRPGTSVSSVAGQTGVITASALRTSLNVADGAEVNVQADWDEVDSSSDAYIQNKPSIPTQLSQLSEDSTHRLVTDAQIDAWTAHEQNVQADWTEADASSDAYIQNKPVLSTVATSGAYSDLSGLPTLGTASALDFGTSAGNVPVLDSNGKLVDSVLPDLSISDLAGTVSLKTDLANLIAQKGDWAQVIGDTAANNGSYIYTGSTWVRMASAAEVSSVNSHTGAVTLRQTATIAGDGVTTTFTIPHALGVIPSIAIYESTGERTGTRMVATTSNVVLTFYSAPAVGDTFTVVMNE